METATIKKKSNHNAISAVIVFAFIALGLSVAMFAMYSFKQELAHKDQILDKKDQMIADKDSTLSRREKEIYSKTVILHSLQQEINELGDSTLTIEISFRKEDGEIDQNGCQLWDWNIWLTGSVHRLNQIDKVYYKVQGVKMGHSNRASTERTNGFLVRYTHHDCLESIKITIQYEGGDMEILYANACERFNGFQVQRYDLSKSL